MSRPDEDLALIRKLAELLNDSGLGEIEYETNGRRVRLAKQPPATTSAPIFVGGGMPAMASAPVAAASAAPSSAASVVDDASNPGAVKSPMVGTAYLSPEPGKPAFVNIGDKVAAGQTLLIIEAMKTFNPIKAPKAGTVSKIIIGNAQPVEFGQVLLIVD
ncbi:MAG: acetyl-CoA carboxylase biotin carboxyl carrier protein [Alphaproteobacteria bacterium]|nr:acetyl-CoA carboxylase biotin carboxyl carrier protein [Alphaproteobacteria bacterium]MCW5739386.1 acetyl-CoA carboxylase biotin carboxyl carrier protein [Alphaproteobacteria bacterium]